MGIYHVHSSTGECQQGAGRSSPHGWSESSAADLVCRIAAIKNIIVIQFILQAGNIMSIGFEKAYALQTDMNLPASEILSTYVYRIGLLNGDYGYFDSGRSFSIQFVNVIF